MPRVFGIHILAMLAPILGLLAATDVHGADAGHAARPNVIIVVTDDQGYGDLSCLGNPVLKTPNLDRLRAESLRLTDFHVTSLCSPTRGELLTGRDALVHGATNTSSGRSIMRRDLPTMADVFIASGYRTGLFGKWHLGDNYPYRPQDRGFQETICFPGFGVTSSAGYFNDAYFDDHYRHNGVVEQYHGYCTDVWFTEAMRWMEDRGKRGDPFLCYLPTNAPHWPFFVPERYRRPFRQQPSSVAGFLGMIANIDENMGRLDSLLRRTGLRDNTILIFMSDNGTAGGASVFNAGMRGDKESLYEGGHRVPCFIRWPAGKLRPSGDIDELSECQDILPTLADLCHLHRPNDPLYDGSSLAGLLRGQLQHLEDRMLVIQFGRIGAEPPQKGYATVMWNHWRLVEGRELYDIKTDPGQRHNVIANHPDIADRMRRHYDAWWSKVAGNIERLAAISLGNDAENPVHLSPADWLDSYCDQTNHVRDGLSGGGTWNVLVERAGQYAVTLRRWPEEADTPITAGVSEHQGAVGRLPAGKALPIARGTLKIAKVNQSHPVGPRDKAITFRVELPAGATHLEATFSDSTDKQVWGAYYVTVRRL